MDVSKVKGQKNIICKHESKGSWSGCFNIKSTSGQGILITRDHDKWVHLQTRYNHPKGVCT